MYVYIYKYPHVYVFFSSVVICTHLFSDCFLRTYARTIYATHSNWQLVGALMPRHSFCVSTSVLEPPKAAPYHAWTVGWGAKPRHGKVATGTPPATLQQPLRQVDPTPFVCSMCHFVMIKPLDLSHSAGFEVAKFPFGNGSLPSGSQLDMTQWTSLDLLKIQLWLLESQRYAELKRRVTCQTGWLVITTVGGSNSQDKLICNHSAAHKAFPSPKA